MSTLTPEVLLADSAWLRRLALRLTGDADDAADLQQEVALATLESAGRGRALGRAWMAAVARNLAALVRRRSARETARLARVAVPEASAATADLVATAELQHRAAAAVLALAPAYRDTVLLRFLRGMTLDETATHLGVPVETVRTRQRRALAQLRARLVPDRAPRGLASLVSLGSFLKGTHVAAAVAACLLLGFGTAPLWWSAAGPPPAVEPVLPIAVDPAAQRGEAPRAAAAPRERTALAQPPRPTPAAPPPPPADASLVVSVRWADDRTAAVGIPVVCREASSPATIVDTDAEGVARFDGLAAGDYLVSPGAALPTPAQVEAGAAREVTLTMPRGEKVEGQVLDPDGTPVAGAEVFAMHAGAWPSHPVLRARTDALGRFAIAGVGERQMVGARHRDWGVSESPVIAPDRDGGGGAQQIVLRFAQRGTSSLRGRVVDPRGAPVAGAWVQVHRRTVIGIGPDGKVRMPPPPSLTGTDGDGVFVAEWLGEGEYRLMVYCRGFAPHERQVELRLGEQGYVDVRLAPGATLTGTVCGPDGKPVVGAVVSSARLQAPQRNHVRVTEDGRFEFVDLPPGELELTVVHRDWSRLVHTVVIAGTSPAHWDAVLVAGGIVTGRLVDSDGNALRNWFVQRPASARYARTDGDGRFTLPECAPEGNVLLVRPEGFAPVRARFEGIAAAPGEQRLTVPADSAPTAHLRGRCIDDTGAPVPDAVIHVVQEGVVVDKDTRTQADGTFDVGPLPPGRYRVLPRHATLRFEPVDQEVGPHAVVDLPLSRGERLREGRRP